jgi:DNA-binding transcriptional MerR regulator
MPSKNNKKMNHSTLSVKEIMRKYKLSYQTVNHYTDFGLLPISSKKGNVRLYDRRVVDSRRRKIRGLMGEGYSLRLIRKKLIGI